MIEVVGTIFFRDNDQNIKNVIIATSSKSSKG